VTLKYGFGVVQGHWKWHNSKALYGFLFAFCSNYGHIAVSLAVCQIFSVKECRDLEKWVRGCSRSL